MTCHCYMPLQDDLRPFTLCIYLLSILFYYLQYLCYDLPLLHAVAGRPAPIYIMNSFIYYLIIYYLQ